MVSGPVLVAFTCAALAAQAPLRVGDEFPGMLDLRNAAAADWVPGDSRDPAQTQARAQAWAGRVAPFLDRAAIRILLPRGPERIPLLLAASQALHAQAPSVAIFLAFDPEGEALWDETAWGAVQGGVLLPQDLGPDPEAWPGMLARAQAFLPGRPWTLWLPSDPGPLLSQLLGDGARVVLPATDPGAGTRLAAQVPGGFTDLEGGLGKLLLRNPRTGEERHWRFSQGAWISEAAPRDRHEVAVTGREAYDVGALLAKVRAERLRESLRIRNREADLSVDLHIQADQGPGTDLGFRFRHFASAGEPEESLQKEVLFNGVKAKLHPGLQLPIVESRTSMAAPAALTLTERYRYQDGGSAGPGRRKLLFRPVDDAPGLYTGSLLVEEGTGRVLEERSSRSGLPGMVKSEDRTLVYGEGAPGSWMMLHARTFERWVVGQAVAQVERSMDFSNLLVNDPGFEARRAAARTSDGTMLRTTPDGLRYYNKQKDGTRVTEAKPRASGRAIGGLLLVDPTLPLPVIPLGGLAYFDFNAFDRGIQVNALIAGVFNRGEITVPSVGAGFDFSASTAFLLLPSTERPIRNGHLVDGEGVGRKSGSLDLRLGHDLGAGFRFQAGSDFTYNGFSKPWGEKYWTEGYQLPPSGWTRTLSGELSWLHRGFRLKGNHAWAFRPAGAFGLQDRLEAMDDRFRRWGGSAGYDFPIAPGQWLHGEVGFAGGKGFNRFQSLDVGGLGGEVRVAGIRSNAIAADRLTYAKAGLVLPTGPSLRLTLSLDQAWLRALDDQKAYSVTGLGVAGDLPGFWWFTTVRVDLGAGLFSTLPGVRSFNGFVALMRVF